MKVKFYVRLEGDIKDVQSFYAAERVRLGGELANRKRMDHGEVRESSVYWKSDVMSSSLHTLSEDLELFLAGLDVESVTRSGLSLEAQVVAEYSIDEHPIGFLLDPG